jgi:hypothetical protein
MNEYARWTINLIDLDESLTRIALESGLKLRFMRDWGYMSDKVKLDYVIYVKDGKEGKAVKNGLTEIRLRGKAVDDILEIYGKISALLKERHSENYREIGLREIKSRELEERLETAT